MSLTDGKLLHLLRPAYSVDENDKKYSSDFLKQMLVNLQNKQAIIFKSLTPYWDELINIIQKLYVGRSKYTYIIDGRDFLTHVYTRTSKRLYNHLVDLYSVQYLYTKYEYELRSRIPYSTLDCDEIIDKFIQDNPTTLLITPRQPKPARRNKRRIIIDPGEMNLADLVLLGIDLFG